MTGLFAFLPLIAVLGLMAAVAAARGDGGRRPQRAMAAARYASLGALGVAAASAAAVAVFGATTSPLVGVAGIGLSFRLDALSGVMILVISFVGAIVVQFSRNYLDGEARQGEFFGGLCATLAAALLLVSAGNLGQLVASWIAMSLALHQLLTWREDRPRALAAAFKKGVFARIGDLALMGAASALIAAFGTADIATLTQAARAAGEAGDVPAGAGLAAGFIALAALLKSAQFPAHGWLPEVVGTPTPVSALLHAGVVNAGGFLAVRFADVLVLSPGALVLLAAVGGFTAIFGAAVMLTQPTAKGALAWSTISQMGFMMLQCGLGAFSLAVLHIAAHSLYKAYAFLSAGEAAQAAASGRALGKAPTPAARDLAIGLVAAVALYVLGGVAFGLARFDAPQSMALGAIMAIGLGHLIVQGLGDDRAALKEAVALAAAVAFGYAALQAGAAALMAGAVPPDVPATPLKLALIALAVVSFAVAALAQAGALLPASDPRARALRVHVANGLYVDAWMERTFAPLRRRGAGAGDPYASTSKPPRAA